MIFKKMLGNTLTYQLGRILASIKEQGGGGGGSGEWGVGEW